MVERYLLLQDNRLPDGKILTLSRPMMIQRDRGVNPGHRHLTQKRIEASSILVIPDIHTNISATKFVIGIDCRFDIRFDTN